MLEFKAARIRRDTDKHLRSPGSVTDAVSGFLAGIGSARYQNFLSTIHLQSFTLIESLTRSHFLQIDNDLRSALEKSQKLCNFSIVYVQHCSTCFP